MLTLNIVSCERAIDRHAFSIVSNGPDHLALSPVQVGIWRPTASGAEARAFAELDKVFALGSLSIFEQSRSVP